MVGRALFTNEKHHKKSRMSPSPAQKHPNHASYTTRLSTPKENWFYHPLIMRVWINRVPPKELMLGGELGYVNQSLNIYYLT